MNVRRATTADLCDVGGRRDGVCPAAGLFLALSGDGAPCSSETFRQRFDQFLASKMAGQEPGRMCMTLDW